MVLMMISMAAVAQVKVEIGKFEGGTIKEKEQTKPDDKGLVTVTITVTPDKGYTISSKDITVVSTIPPTGLSSGTRTPQIASTLTLLGTDPKDLSEERDYRFIVGSTLGAWVKEAKFQNDGKKEGNRNVSNITSLSQISSADGHYVITSDISGGTPGVSDFSGTLEAAIDPDTKMPYRIKDLSAPLFTTLTGTVKNLVLEDVSISDHEGNTGAIACTANGDNARIYNVGILSGSVGGSAYTGGLVGILDGKARVINCYSYATITGGSNVGGIVGYNNATSNSDGITTMVMNCMFYGDITGGTTVSPVYGGKNINNLKDKSGLNTFNFYVYDKLKSKKINAKSADDTDYNCALAVEERFLTRFEIYRQLLNSNKKLAAWYITGNPADAGILAKWVLETADRTIANPKPYPVLKSQGYYPSIINPDFENAPDSATVGRNKGGKLPFPRATLTVTIDKKSKPTGGQSWPANAEITKTTLNLKRTDMDGDRFNFNYDKVQLPYYNDVGTGNYTKAKSSDATARVVTGWMITSITGGTGGSYSTGDQWGGYNFADRNCTNKDLYSESKRVFSQGAYWDVPYGVTAITIEPYWGEAAFIADPYYDEVYTSSYGNKTGRTAKQVENTTTFNGVSVKTTVNDAYSTLSTGGNVYDHAIVLVGNFHQDVINGKEPFKSGTKPFTWMSVDEDNDHEPDYSLIFHDNNRSRVPGIRFDFLNVPGTAQAQKPNATGTVLNTSVFNASAWFEITNTCNIYFSQFEYENLSKASNSPIILLGGVFDQFTSTKTNEVKYTAYLHVGGNVSFKDFANGTHSDGNKKTKHIPISVTGGEYKGFYLTGTYNPNAAVSTDAAECYISGGHFFEAAGAGQEQIDGNVRWQIYNADIDNFYGGGINANKPIKGEVTVDIVNSHVGNYCGGPKFGNMQSGKEVTTTATGCTFGKFYGAGYGGASYSRVKYMDVDALNFSSWQSYYTGDRGKFYDGVTTPGRSGYNYGFKGFGVATDFDYEFFVWTSGKTGGRFFVKFASFSLAQCNKVSSTLTNCIINGNFYGGGKLGKVVGDITSVLDGCTVNGNVFGAGYSASKEGIEVRKAGFDTSSNHPYPTFNSYSGMFEPGNLSGTDPFEWVHTDNYPANGATGGLDESGDPKYVKTTENLASSNLGSVDGNVNLTIKGDSKIGTLIGGEGSQTVKDGTGNVFGGGESSYVSGTNHTVTVTLQGDAEVYGNVFGGGDNGVVEGSTVVNIKDGND